MNTEDARRIYMPFQQRKEFFLHCLVWLYTWNKALPFQPKIKKYWKLSMYGNLLVIYVPINMNETCNLL